MSVREYIGARYVPLFADPIEWDNTKTYEPLTIVYYQGNSYTSRQAVPTGIAITNTTYWALTGNYNAQIEAYRAEVQEFADDISELQGDVTSIEGDVDTLQTDVSTAKGNITTLQGDVTTIEGDISTLQTTLQNAMHSKAIPIMLDKKELVFLGDSYAVGYQDSTGTDLPLADRFTKLVANNLGMNLHDYSEGGAGFSESYGTSISTFPKQAQAAAADTTYDHDNVGLVIIIGGRNDYSTSNDNLVVNGVESTIQQLITAFPNARIFYAFAYDWGRTGNKAELRMWHNMRIIYRTMQYYAKSVFVAKNSWTWFLGQKELFDNGSLHPNTYGHKAFAQMILQSIIGGSSSSDNYIFTEGVLGANLNSNGACCYAERDGSLLHIHFHANIKTVPNANFTAATLFNLGGWGGTNDFIWSFPAYLNLRHCRVMPVFSNGNLNLVIGLITGGATWSDFVVGNTLEFHITIPWVQEGPNLLS